MIVFIKTIILLLALIFTMFEVNQTFNWMIASLHRDSEDTTPLWWLLAVICWVIFYYLNIAY